MMPREPYFNINRAMTYLIIGLRGAGKSALLATIAEKYYRTGHVIFDTFSATDYESCYWAIKGKLAYPCIFILPDYADFEIPPPYRDLITIRKDSEGLRGALECALSERRILVFVNSAYEDEHMLSTLSTFYNELVPLNNELDVDIALIIREVRHLAGTNLNLYENAKMTKVALTKLATIARHHRITTILDLQNITSLFKSVRDLSDRVIIKRSLPSMIPDEFSWVLKRIENQHNIPRGTPAYRAILKKYPKIYSLYPNEGYFLRTDGRGLSKAKTQMPGFKSKQEKDNFFKITGIKMTVDEDLKTEITEKNTNNLSRVDHNYQKRHATGIQNLLADGKSKKYIANIFGYTQGAAVTQFIKTHPEYFT